MKDTKIGTCGVCGKKNVPVQVTVWDGRYSVWTCPACWGKIK